jgi:hypothetical protein
MKRLCREVQGQTGGRAEGRGQYPAPVACLHNRGAVHTLDSRTPGLPNCRGLDSAPAAPLEEYRPHTLSCSTENSSCGRPGSASLLGDDARGALKD